MSQIRPSSSAYRLLPARRRLRRRQALQAREGTRHAGRRHDRSRQHLRRRALFQCGQRSGIKPILGCELYVCKKEDHRAAPEGDSYNHLLVLAENEEGYRNLVKIVSEASLHGFYYKPRVSKRFLAEHSQGLIGLSGCLKGEVAEELTEGKYDAARDGGRDLSGHLRQRQFLPRDPGPGTAGREAHPDGSVPARAGTRTFRWSRPTTATTSAKTTRTRRT